MARRKRFEDEYKFEVVECEPMKEEQVDALANLFANAIVEKMLKKRKATEITHSHKSTAK